MHLGLRRLNSKFARKKRIYRIVLLSSSWWYVHRAVGWNNENDKYSRLGRRGNIDKTGGRAGERNDAADARPTKSRIFPALRFAARRTKFDETTSTFPFTAEQIRLHILSLPLLLYCVMMSSGTCDERENCGNRAITRRGTERYCAERGTTLSSLSAVVLRFIATVAGSRVIVVIALLIRKNRLSGSARGFQNGTAATVAVSLITERKRDGTKFNNVHCYGRTVSAHVPPEFRRLS